MLYVFSRFLAMLFCRGVLRLKIYGRENIPKTGGFILASNHTSYLDPLALGVACTRRVDFMARHDLFDHYVLRWWLLNVGAFPVKRGSADLSAIKEAMRRIRSGRVLVVFPEGSRRFDGPSAEPHAGIGFFASKLDVPVVPAFIRGTDIALPKGAKKIKPTQISVHFGKQIFVERRMPYQDIADTIMDKIRHLS